MKKILFLTALIASISVQAARPISTPVNNQFDFLPQNYERGTYCFKQAAETHQISEKVLRSIAYVETGDFEHGTFIFSKEWFPYAQKKGVEWKDLNEPCLVIHLGANYLKDLRAKYGEEQYINKYCSARKSPNLCAIRIQREIQKH